MPEAGTLTKRIRRRLDAEFETYAAIPAGALDRGAGMQVTNLLRVGRAGREAAAGEDLSALAEIGDARAREGVPIEDVMRAWRVGNAAQPRVHRQRAGMRGRARRGGRHGYAYVPGAARQPDLFVDHV